MVIKKKISCLILAFCALVALCATSAYADPLTPNQYCFGVMRGTSGASFSSSSALPLNVSMTNSIYGKVFVGANTLTFNNTPGSYWYHGLFQVPSSFTSFDFDTVYVGGFQNNSNSYVELSFSDYQRAVTVSGDVTLCDFYINFVLPSNYNFNYNPLVRFSCNYPYASYSFSLIALEVGSGEYVVEPPEAPGFSGVEANSYYACLSPLNGNWLPTHEYDSLPASPIDPDYVVSRNSSECALLLGQISDYSNIIKQYSVITVKAQILISDPNSYSGYRPSVTGEVYFCNHPSPNYTNFQSRDVMNCGFSPDPVISVWSQESGSWSYLVSLKAYIVVYQPENVNISYPYGTISAVFRSTTLHTSDVYWTPYSFEVSYVERSSSSAPLPDNPFVNTPSASESDNTMNEELAWGNEQADSVFGSSSDSVSSAMDALFPDHPWALAQSSFEALYSGLSYTGSGGTLYFPSATIPWNGSTLKLWDQQEIPFSYFINNMPTVYCTIISCLLLFGSGFALLAILMNFIRKLWFGDIRSDKF